jgi:parvulin-like peptidyl-prolyl isomerase
MELVAVETTNRPHQNRKRAPQRAVPHSVRRSGKPLIFGWGAHLTHHEREQVKERIAMGIGISLAVAVVAILGYGLYQDKVAKPAAIAAARNAPVATIGNQTITRGWYNKVLGYQKQQLSSQLTSYQNAIASLQSKKSKTAQAQLSQYQAVMQQIQTAQGSVAQNTYSQLVDTAIVQQRGAAAGLHLTQAQKKKFLHNLIYKQAGSLTNFKAAAASHGFSVAAFKNLLLGNYEVSQLQTILANKVKKTSLEAHTRNILLKTKAKAETVKKQLVAHQATWKQLALKYNTDSTKTTGGDLGWSGKGQMVPQFDKVAFSAPVGSINIVHSTYGWHVMQVIARGQHKLSATQLQTDQQNALNTWIAKQQKSPGYYKQELSPAAIQALEPASASGLPSGLGLPQGSTLP